jgi:signal transduction histidine kinase/ActR/RegA family two-component response regulator
VADIEDLADAAGSLDVTPRGLELLQEQYEILTALREKADTMTPRAQEALLLRGKESMDGIRSILESLVERKEAQREAALATRERLHRQTSATLWFGAVGGVVGGALAVMLFVREIARRVRILQRNSRLVGTDSPLAPVGGKDEIAELADALEETNAELARKETLRQSAEARMAESRDEAARANQAKNEFLSRMSHELRTPLNSVLGFAQLLEMDDLRADQRENVHNIVRGGKHLLALINEVLDIARIESGSMSLSVEPVDVRRVVEEVVALTEPLATKRAIDLHVKMPESIDVSHVMADQQRLKQIILNLLSNAIKYNVRGGSVEVAVARDDHTVRISVSDTGPGLTEEQMHDLFKPFNRLGAEDTGVEGTGLGLALSKGLADAMGGTLAATSRAGEGARFTLALAVADGRAKPPVATAHETNAARAETRTATVLYIEDNEANLALVRAVLARRPGIRLLAATRGESGIRLARKSRPDVILLDLNLPDIQGDDVLKILRRDPDTAGIPIVILSADATPRQEGRLEAAGAVAYLTKPLDVPRLLTLLDRMLEEDVA